MLNNTLGNNTLGNTTLDEGIIKKAISVIAGGLSKYSRKSTMYKLHSVFSGSIVSSSKKSFVNSTVIAGGKAIAEMGGVIMTRSFKITAGAISGVEDSKLLKRSRKVVAGASVTSVKKFERAIKAIAGSASKNTFVFTKVLSVKIKAGAKAINNTAVGLSRKITATAGSVVRAIIPDKYYYDSSYTDQGDSYENEYEDQNDDYYNKY